MNVFQGDMFAGSLKCGYHMDDSLSSLTEFQSRTILRDLFSTTHKTVCLNTVLHTTNYIRDYEHAFV